MKISVRDADGKLNLEALEQSVEDFFNEYPDGAHSITELSKKEAEDVEEYFGEYITSVRKIIKSKSGVVDYRLDLKMGD